MRAYEGLSEEESIKARLLGDNLFFTQTFFKVRTATDFRLSSPKGRECRHKIVHRALKDVYLGKIKRLIVSFAPRYGKTEDLVSFMAWATALNPKCNWIYVSFAQQVAARQTQLLRDIISMPEYRNMFGVELDAASTAKHNFKTTAGGEVLGVGSGGQITSRGAGIAYAKEFSGAIIVDDLHKPKNVFSDTIRQSDNTWFYNTLFSRLNDPPTTPIIVTGQRLHEDDLIANLMKEMNPDGTPVWTVINLPALDEAGNALDEDKHTVAMLRQMEELDRYTFWSQYQGDPQPAGGGIFRPEDFLILDEEPELIMSFITADTAETALAHNDASAFGFFGLYKIKVKGVETGEYALHWIDQRELRVEPRDLESEFMSFYLDCMRHKTPPSVAIIEKKSTGVTLASILKDTPGLKVIPLDRNISDGNKISRYFDCQHIVASHRVTLTNGAKHVHMCVEHMRKITGNGSHAHDDIADCMQSAIQCALIDKILIPKRDTSKLIQPFANQVNRISHLRRQTL